MEENTTPQQTPQQQQRMKVSFAANVGAGGRSLRVSFIQLPGSMARTTLIPPEVLTPKGREVLNQNQENENEPTFEGENQRAEDPARSAVLIYPKKINDLKRFRMLFVGLLLFIVSSTQGVHSLFGTILMAQHYQYTVKQMVHVYLTGCAFGMFVFPFGVLYDWFGPRPVVTICIILTALGHILFALMFRGDIDNSVRNSCLVYGLMCWGCYGLQVAVLPAVLSHMPRDRGQPTGLLQTFSGLGASFISCLFRGFFNDHFDNLMWFMLALTVVFGIIGICYLEDAPYITNRWGQRSITPHQQLRKHLIRNRYMSQLVPKRRYFINAGILLCLNFYLTIQAVVVAYKADKMTKGKYRGIAIGATIITCSTAILAVPLHSIDGVSPQDEEVIRTAKEKEEQLMQAKEARDRDEWRARQQQRQPDQNSTEPALLRERSTSILSCESNRGVNTRARRGGAQSRYVPVSPQRDLVEIILAESSEDDNDDNAEQGNIAADANETAVDIEGGGRTTPVRSPGLRASFCRTSPMLTNISPTLQRREASTHQIEVSAHEPSTFNKPYFETINVCGEVFVTPVYQTTFLESLTYLDLWMVFYTTTVMWGVGMTMTGNWNIQIMLMARYFPLNPNDVYKTYILFAAMSGVATAGGRVFLGLYERVLQGLRQNFGVVLPGTIGYPIASVGMFFSMVMWIALPGDLSLVTAYLIGPFFFGMSSSMTMYVLGTIFDRDLGMHYGFCFLGASIGMILFYYLSFFLPYDDHSVTIPGLGFRCLAQRKCMNKTLIIYIVMVFSTIFSSYLVHRRYEYLVQGKLKHRRVIGRTLQKLFSSEDVNHLAEEEANANDNNNNNSSSAADAPVNRTEPIA